MSLEARGKKKLEEDNRMSERITLRGLVGLLVQRKQMQEADAEAFVNTLSTLLEEALVADRYLKIKKFGTFKLIDTEEGRDTLSFVPDKILSDARAF